MYKTLREIWYFWFFHLQSLVDTALYQRSVFFRLSYPPFLNRQGESHYPDPARLVSDSGTKVPPLLGSGNRGCVKLSVSYRNVSPALSLLNKVYNSIYSTRIQSLVKKILLPYPFKKLFVCAAKPLTSPSSAPCSSTPFPSTPRSANFRYFKHLGFKGTLHPGKNFTVLLEMILTCRINVDDSHCMCRLYLQKPA